MRQYDYAVVIGRFQPVHQGHEYLIKEALEIADDVIIIVGSSFGSRTTKNPFTFEERARMISLVTQADSNRVNVVGIADYVYSEQKWLMEVQRIIDASIYGATFKVNPNICVVGHSKDNATEEYLKLFPQYNYIEVEAEGPIDATTVRDHLFTSENTFNSTAKLVLSKPVHNFLTHWKTTDSYKRLKEEYRFIQETKNRWKFAPYEPTFVTTDAVVVESGHILLIKRGDHPGKGQWALPGGYINPNEDLMTSCIRELHEETKLKVPKKVLRGSITKQRVYADVDRDPRGRFITHAYLFELAPCPSPNQKLTKVIASDDAAHAEWIPLNKVKGMKEEFFLDHYDIIFEMIGG